ncbi:hypothetical protein [Parablautia muri]|uniref:Uncharacterized protein n=1 Tax=Parablautia muri TaxID=2320879 RepID=A0A9X5BJK6_9FIRM|nr:hypothetical protein [Parablautia muri]NBJ94918.1 hypothetical protein [Parablautia muri]
MKEYPTDEELELLISQLEKQELYAPRHLKEEILKQAFPEQTVEALPKSGGGERAVQLFTYRLKIIAGMAAAIFMLAVLPSLGWESRYETGWEREDQNGQKMEIAREMRDKQDDMEKDENTDLSVNLNYILNENMRKTSERMNSFVGQINFFK